jgi:hypothetical protein
MSVLQQAEKYFAAWNNHDTDAITALFAPGGSYSDPNVPEGASGWLRGRHHCSLFRSGI